MISIEVTRRLIAETLEDSGLQGRGSVWRLVGPELQWIVEIDRPPNGMALAVDIGGDLRRDPTIRHATDCPLMLNLETMPFVRDMPILEALHLESRMDPEFRREVIVVAVRALGDYLRDHLTFARIGDAYRAGDLRAGFIHKDLRSRLESQRDG